MKKISSLLLAFILVFLLVGCRSNTPHSNTSSALSDNENSENVSDVQLPVCIHTNTTLANQSDATCTTNGYTGDTICTECNAIILTGTQIPPNGHNTEIRNQKDATILSQGYSGDTYCKVCGIITAAGEVIPAFKDVVPAGKAKYTSDNGYIYVIDEGINITEYSMKQQTKYIESKYRDIELEIFNLCNKEREKYGLAPLEWYEDAYYFTHVRSGEIYYNWDHIRPNGSQWHTVYTDANVILNAGAENLAQRVGIENIALGTVEAWMDSTSGHRESILNPNFTKMSIAITYNENTFVSCVAQHFFN